MKIIRLVGLSGIVEKFRGILERAKMAFEETAGPKCNKIKLQCEHYNPKIGRHFPPHVDAIFSNGTTDGGLGKVVYGVG